MKRRAGALLLSFLILLMFSGVSMASGGVPKQVLKAAESVVRIVSEYSDGFATGSGFVIRSDGNRTLIVTNHHVVEGNPLTIAVMLGNEELIDAKVLAASPNKDLCVLELAYPVSYRALPIAKKGGEQGQPVYAIGFPGAADEFSDTIAQTSEEATITNGIISALRHTDTSGTGTQVSILQINADINSGNSGGPLLNERGHVLGVNTYGVLDSQGINGAVAAEELIALLQDYDIPYKKAGAGLWPIAAIVGAVLLAAGVLVFLKKKKAVWKGRLSRAKKAQPVSLRTYMAGHPDGLEANAVVSLLMPAALRLREMHHNGTLHLQVSPDSMWIKDGRAELAMPTQSEADRYISGFAAPEVYSGKGLGTAADVYSYCAVLAYALTGTIPENALSRSIEKPAVIAQVTERSKALVEVLEQGLVLDTEARNGDMQSLIIALAPFNVGMILPEAASALTPASEEPGLALAVPEQVKREKKPINKKKLICTIAVAAVSAVMLAYCVTFGLSWYHAGKGDLNRASKTLLLPGVTRLHSPKLTDYVLAGKLMEQRDYEEAIAAFEALFKEDYRDSGEMVKECKYRRAGQLADKGSYEEAIALYRELGYESYKDAKTKKSVTEYNLAQQVLYDDSNYSLAVSLLKNCLLEGYEPARELLTEANFLWGLSLADEEDYAGALEKLNLAKDHPDAAEATEVVKDIIYLDAVSDYRTGRPLGAEEGFVLIPGYKRTDDFMTLINIKSLTHSYAGRKWYQGHVPNTVKDLQALIGFEDAGEILVSTQKIAQEFLTGTWRAKSGGYKFSIDEKTGRSSYDNLAYINYGKYYEIQDGIYYLYYEDKWDERREQFGFTVLSKDCIEIYCYKNSKTYTLYRQ